MVDARIASAINLLGIAPKPTVRPLLGSEAHSAAFSISTEIAIDFKAVNTRRRGPEHCEKDRHGARDLACEILNVADGARPIPAALLPVVQVARIHAIGTDPDFVAIIV